MDRFEDTIKSMFNSVLFWVFLFLFALLFSFISEAQSEKHITQVLCEDTQVNTIIKAPEHVFELEWDKYNGWHYPRYFTNFPDYVLVKSYGIRFSNGDSGFFIISPWYMKEPKIALLLLWNGNTPDYANIGDRNPHPHEMLAYWYKDIEHILEECEYRIDNVLYYKFQSNI